MLCEFGKLTQWPIILLSENKFISNPFDKDRLFYPIRLQNRIKVKIDAKNFIFLFVCITKGFMGLFNKNLSDGLVPE